MFKQILNFSLRFVLLFSIGYFLACVPEQQKKEANLDHIHYDQSNAQAIWSQALEGQIDSITSHLNSDVPVERFLALQMLSNQRGEVPILEVSKLLDDPLDRIQMKAAYVLGQTHASEAASLLINAFDQNDSLAKKDHFHCILLEAVGKTGNARHALQIAQVKSYTPRDSLLTLGQARALFQFGSRNIITKETKEKMVDFLTTSTYAKTVRAIAAEYLIRMEVGSLDSFEYALKRSMRNTEDPELLERLAYLLPKVGKGTPSLVQKFETHPDPSVRLAFIRALTKAEWTLPDQRIKDFLKDKNEAVAYEAAQYFITKGQEDQAVVYREWAQEEGLELRVKYALYGAALKHLPFYYQLTKTTLVNEMKQEYSSQSDDYYKAELIRSFAMDPGNIPYLMEIYQDSATALYNKTQALSGIRSAMKDERYRLLLQGRSNAVKRSVLDLVKSACLEGHAGAICEGALILRDQSDFAIQYLNDLSFLQKAYDRLEFPSDTEAALFLKETAAELEFSIEVGKEPKQWAMPDTSILHSLADSSIVQVTTSKGKFSFNLRPEEAPFTVSRFVKSVKEGYYDQKVWHRVVPNFVAQTGCPDGDGYGSTNFTIPTESSEAIHYTGAGKIGMASAGVDTESSQWFITYGPTPHLDGRYTIFAEVISGMEVIDQLMVGDQILNIEIKK